VTPRPVSPFRNASNLLDPNLPELSYGCVMADIDGCGRPEILVVNVGGANRLYKWQGARLVDVATPEIQDEETSGIGVACADMTGNGHLDIYLLNTSAFLGPESDPDRLLLNHGGMRFTDLFEHSNTRNFGAGRSVVWWDVDGTGLPAAYVCNYAEPCRLFAIENGELRNLAPLRGLNQVTGGRSAVVADFFGSGRLDLFTCNENDANRFFLNEGKGRSREIARELGLDDPETHGRGLAVCDLNRDGLLDLVWANWEGFHRIFLQEPGRKFTNVASPAFARPSRARTVIVFDYDNDGWEDIFVHNLGEPNRLFHNNGDGTFTELEMGELAMTPGLGTGATCGDLDGDGFLDLFLSQGEGMPQRNALFLNTPNGNHWLRVHAQTPAGAPAVGARVTVFAEGDDRPMIRHIDGGSGYLCQMEPVAHFGLGAATRAARVEVRWTTGATWAGEGIPADQNLVVKPS